MFEPAPLLDIPEAPVPPGAEPDWFTGAGGVRLRAALFTPVGRARGSVVLSGGRTEPIEKYYETIRDFLDRGFVVLAHDWRGQGLSVRELPDRLKGHARGFKPFLDDYRRLLDAYQSRLPRPWVAVGHSMGGCLTLLALAHGEKRFAGAVLSAPMLGLQFGKRGAAGVGLLTAFSVAFGRAGHSTPGAAAAPPEDSFEDNILTHDATRFRRWRAQVAANPDLALGAPTWGWLDFALKACAWLARPEHLRDVTIPVDIVSAGEEALVDNAALAAAARNLPQGRLIHAPRARHEILMETDEMRNIFMRVFDALTGKAAPRPADAPKPAPAPAAAEPVAPEAAAPDSVTTEPVAAAAPEPVTAKPAPAPKPKVAAKTAPPAPPKAAAKPKAAATKAAAAPKAAAKPVAAPKSPAVKPARAVPPKAAAKPPAAKSPAAKPPAAKAPPAKPAVAKAAPKAAAKPAPAKAKAPAKKTSPKA